MKNKASILTEVADYVQRFPGEKEKIKDFLLFVETINEDELYNRKNFIGHITASAFVINKEWNSVLMIKHNFLKRWLQPGGHVDEKDESLVAAAQREVHEETGLLPEAVIPLYNYIFDIDSHPIPENKKKNELAHVHHDARFLFMCTSPNIITIDANEVTAGEWVSINQLETYPDFKLVANKILYAKGLLK